MPEPVGGLVGDRVQAYLLESGDGREVRVWVTDMLGGLKELYALPISDGEAVRR